MRPVVKGARSQFRSVRGTAKALPTAASNSAARSPGTSVNTMAGAVFGATSLTWASRLDWISTTAASSATPRPMAGAAVRAAERGPARLAMPMRTAPRAKPRSRPASRAAPRPSAQSRPKAKATPAIMIPAAIGVGAVITARPARPAPASRATITSGPKAIRPVRSRRNSEDGGVALARASGARLKAAAASRPNRAALSSGIG